MNSGIFVCIYDSKAETYSQPTVARSNADALRQFEFLVNDTQKTLVSMHPADFTLYRIGSYEDYKLITEDRQALANGVDVVNPHVAVPEVSVEK